MIVPVVLHHSDKGWTTSTAFEELLDADEALLAAVAAYVPRFRFVLDDISHASDEALKARAMSARWPHPCAPSHPPGFGNDSPSAGTGSVKRCEGGAPIREPPCPLRARSPAPGRSASP